MLAGPAQADPAADIAKAVAGGEVVDLTVTISENYPAHWPFHPPFRRWTMNWFEKQKGPYTETPLIGAGGKADTVRENLVQSVFPYYSQQMVIDEPPVPRLTSRHISCPRKARASSLSPMQAGSRRQVSCGSDDGARRRH